MSGRRALSLFLNPRAGAGAAYGPAEREILSLAGFDAAHREISSWPGYAPTPLVALPGLARHARIGALWYKDESGRFGLGSFKALGGAYAVQRALAAAKHRDEARTITVTSATAGNHGRAVAWGARTFGCRCVIYIPAPVSAGRAAAIEGYGAEVVRVAGTYDEAVRRAAADAADNGWSVISDTSYPGYMEVPRHVMQGYTVLVDEAMRQLPSDARPTHAFVQAGVGGLAAAVCAHLWESWGGERPRFVVVEPENAACLYQSALAGAPAAIAGKLDTVMTCLAAGEPSLLAWRILERGADAFMTIADAAALDGMARLAAGGDGDPPLVAGESGVGGVAGLLAAALDDGARRDLGLDAASRVLVIGSEGDTDPGAYRRIVGRTAAEVRAAT